MKTCLWCRKPIMQNEHWYGPAEHPSQFGPFCSGSCSLNHHASIDPFPGEVVPERPDIVDDIKAALEKGRKEYELASKSRSAVAVDPKLRFK